MSNYLASYKCTFHFCQKFSSVTLLTASVVFLIYTYDTRDLTSTPSRFSWIWGAHEQYSWMVNGRVAKWICPSNQRPWTSSSHLTKAGQRQVMRQADACSNLTVASNMKITNKCLPRVAVLAATGINDRKKIVALVSTLNFLSARLSTIADTQVNVINVIHLQTVTSWLVANLQAPIFHLTLATLRRARKASLRQFARNTSKNQ